MPDHPNQQSPEPGTNGDSSSAIPDDPPGSDPLDAEAGDDAGDNGGAPAADGAAGRAGDGADADPLAAAQAEVEALKDKALRAAAEADNARRRAARDVENAHRYALEGFVNDLLPVLDSLDAAVASSGEPGDDGSVGAQAGGESAENAADRSGGVAMVEGINLSRKLFLDTLSRHGVSRLEPVGHPFDPKQHQAMAMVESADAEPNQVLAVMQAGYLLNGRVVRAAMVTVTKAPAAG